MTDYTDQDLPCEEAHSLLTEYACGTLDEAYSLLVATYITIHPQARRYVRRCEMIGGSFIENVCEPVSMSSGSLRNILDKISDDMPQAFDNNLPTADENAKDSHLPRPLTTYTHKAKWKKLAPGLQAMTLPVDNCDRKVTLIKMAPGAKLPRKNQTKVQVSLVLDGAYFEGDNCYHKGVMRVEMREDETPMACKEHGCLSLTISGPASGRSNPFTQLFGLLGRHKLSLLPLLLAGDPAIAMYVIL